MMKFQSRLQKIGKNFLLKEISTGFPLIGLIKHPSIIMRMSWCNQLHEAQKNELVEGLFRNNGRSELVSKFESINSDQIGINHVFSSKKILLRKIMNDGGRWKFESISSDAVSAGYKINKYNFRVTVTAGSRMQNILCVHSIYKDGEGYMSSFNVMHCSKFFSSDAWHASGLEADKEYPSVMKILNCGYDMLAEAFGDCDCPFDECS